MEPRPTIMEHVQATDTHIKVLEERLTKPEALVIERSAQRHWRTARRATLLLCAELRRLHDGEAHLLRGYHNFGQYAVEKITPELTEGTAKKFAWRGAPLLTLERHGRLKLDDRATLPVGTTGAQALATVLTQQGEQAMLDVFDLAVTLKPNSPLSDVTVARAKRELLPPPRKTLPAETAEPEPSAQLCRLRIRGDLRLRGAGGRAGADTPGARRPARRPGPRRALDRGARRLAARDLRHPLATRQARDEPGRLTMPSHSKGPGGP